MSNGLIVYEGPSRLDGKPIVCILTGLDRKSTNPKTGAMVQSWILRRDQNPVQAVKTGADASICGNCRHRPLNQGTCYVRTIHAPLSVFRAYKRGAYPRSRICGAYTSLESLTFLALLLADQHVRIGSYGDPAALPVELVETLAMGSAKRTGYTHQGDTFPELREFVMGSADSLADAIRLAALGFRTFRTGADASIPLENEIQCPASAESGKRTDCFRCGLCYGAKPSDPVKNIRIAPHGASAIKFYRMADAIA